MKKRNVEAIDLFCGIGGFTYGLQQAGVRVLAGLDVDESCKYAFEKNNSCAFICADISSFDFLQLSSVYSEDSIKVLVGCAPCQPFSSHTFKVKTKNNDQRWDLINHFVRAIKVLEPHIISMENVRGITKTDVFNQFLSDVKRLGYDVDYQIVYTPDYGIPQSRSRLVLIGSRIGLIKVPEVTHNKEQYTSVSEAIGKLAPIKAGETSENDPIHRAKNLSEINRLRIKQSTPGGTWKDWDPYLLPGCYTKESGQTYTSVYGRMSWDNVAPTITTQFFNYGSGRFGHPDQDRGLSLREGALLQTFPRDYDFGKDISLTKIGRHIGNAVPPRLGTVIGEAMFNHVVKRYGKE
jgi:DNA (cytosine-5)-methyltransferase 1